jgi:hypothetical protein
MALNLLLNMAHGKQESRILVDNGAGQQLFAVFVQSRAAQNAMRKLHGK